MGHLTLVIVPLLFLFTFSPVISHPHRVHQDLAKSEKYGNIANLTNQQSPVSSSSLNSIQVNKGDSDSPLLKASRQTTTVLNKNKSKNNIRLGRSIPTRHPLTNPRTNRIINFLERKNIYKKYNLDRALEEWGRLKGESRTEEEMEGHLHHIIRTLSLKISHDYDKQMTEMRINPNSTGNSLIFRSLLKFFIEGLDGPEHYKHFPFLSQQLRRHGNLDKMSLDDAIIFTYQWNSLIIDGGLLTSRLNSASGPNGIGQGDEGGQGQGQGTEAAPTQASPFSSSTFTWSVDLVSDENERMVRNVVRAGNRIYPAAPADHEPLTINDWWLRQLQHSQSVYKIYNVVDALVKGCRKNGVETSRIYEALVDEYRASGRPLDAFELNMIDFMAYRLFGMIEHSDPNRW